MSPVPKTPLLAVDVVIIRDDTVLLIRRGHPPFLGQFALPGGFVEVGETVEDAARREACEETGVICEIIELVGVYSRPDRDPRGHTVSVVFRGKWTGGEVQAGSDAAAAEWIAQTEVQPDELAFDHADILIDAGFLNR